MTAKELGSQPAFPQLHQPWTDDAIDDTSILDASGEPDCDDDPAEWAEFQTSEE